MFLNWTVVLILWFVYGHDMQFSYSFMYYTNLAYASVLVEASAEWFGYVALPAYILGSTAALSCSLSFVFTKEGEEEEDVGRT